MTDSEKLDLLLEKVMSFDTKITTLGKDMLDVKAELGLLHRKDAWERILTNQDRLWCNRVETAVIYKQGGTSYNVFQTDNK